MISGEERRDAVVALLSRSGRYGDEVVQMTTRLALLFNRRVQYSMSDGSRAILLILISVVECDH